MGWTGQELRTFIIFCKERIVLSRIQSMITKPKINLLGGLRFPVSEWVSQELLSKYFTVLQAENLLNLCCQNSPFAYSLTQAACVKYMFLHDSKDFLAGISHIP